MALHFSAAWVLALPLVDGLALIGSAPAVWLPRLVMVLLPLLVDPMYVVGLGSPVSLGWWVHLHPRIGFYPFTGAFMGLGAEILIPGLDILGIGKRLAHIHLSEQGV